MASSSENETILINLIGIDQRNRNAIEMVLAKEPPGYYAITNFAQASLSIVDLDNFGAEDEWNALLQGKPDQRAILLSVNEAKQNPAHFFLKKPISIDDLMVTLSLARKKQGVDQKRQSSWNKFLSTHLKPADADLPKTRATKSSRPVEEEGEAVRFFSEQGYLIDEVKRAVVEANSEGRGIRLQFKNQGSIFIDPSEHWINTDFTPAGLEDICKHFLNESDVVKRVFTDREFSKYLDEWQETRLKPVDIDSFLWDLALWTYEDSIPAGTDISKKIILNSWPDLPRLTPIPNAMRIAALWVSCPMTLLETIEVLKIPQKDIFNFYTAASTLGLVRQDTGVIKPPQLQPGEKPFVKSEKNQREFYLRILRHLKGQNLDD
ncbi:MAG: hypothetical protein AB8D52_01045 [Gammaproteobacteria bacterium]